MRAFSNFQLYCKCLLACSSITAIPVQAMWTFEPLNFVYVRVWYGGKIKKLHGERREMGIFAC